MYTRNELIERRDRILRTNPKAELPNIYMTIEELQLQHAELCIKFNPEKPLEQFQTFCGFPIVVR